MNAQLAKFFGRLPLTAYLVLAGLAAGGGWLALNNAHQRQLGAERILTAQARAAGDSARAEVKRLSKVLVPQVVTATKWRTKWDSTGLRQLQGTLDSLNALGVPKPETVTVNVPVATLATADTAIKACTEALTTCQALVGAQRRCAEAAETDAKLAWRQVPSKLAPWRHRGEGAAVVLVVLKVAGLLK